MTATYDLDTPVIEALENRCRRLMAERCAVPCWGEGRKQRADLSRRIDVELDNWNRLQRSDPAPL